MCNALLCIAFFEGYFFISLYFFDPNKSILWLIEVKNGYQKVQSRKES